MVVLQDGHLYVRGLGSAGHQERRPTGPEEREAEREKIIPRSLFRKVHSKNRKGEEYKVSKLLCLFTIGSLLTPSDSVDTQVYPHSPQSSQEFFVTLLSDYPSERPLSFPPSPVGSAYPTCTGL